MCGLESLTAAAAASIDGSVVVRGIASCCPVVGMRRTPESFAVRSIGSGVCARENTGPDVGVAGREPGSVPTAVGCGGVGGCVRFVVGCVIRGGAVFGAAARRADGV